MWDLTLDHTYQGQRVQDRKHTASLGQQLYQHRERRREISEKEKKTHEHRGLLFITIFIIR